MTNLELNKTIIDHIETIKNNSVNFLNAFPKLLLAIEMINDLFDQLFVEQYKILKGEAWESSVQKMIFGAHSSVIQSIIMTSAGFNETGLVCIRRGIEYACYASKIKNSDEKNKLWLEKGVESYKDHIFTSKFLIPKAYFKEKYKHLNALLVWHDFASTFGAHGNFTTLFGKWDSSFKNGLIMSYHDNPDRTPLSTGVTVRISYFILKAFIEDFKDNMIEYDKYVTNMKVADDIINSARIEILDYESKGEMNFGDIKAIYSKEDPAIEDMYTKLKEKYCK